MKSDSDSILTPANLHVLEENYRRYRDNPSQLSSEWREYFAALDSSSDRGAVPHIPKMSQLEAASLITDLNLKAHLLVQAYRRHGHFSADTDPLGARPTERFNLDPHEHGISESELDREVRLQLAGEPRSARLRDVIGQMERIYCSSIGTEFFYIRDEARRNWIIDHLESQQHQARLSSNIKLMIFEKLVAAETFERFVAMRFPGKKRFSLEGGESLIPTLASVVENSGMYGIKQIVIGMAHRGRINVLANVMGKDPTAIFAEFNENITEDDVAGDVKYHLGFSSDVQTLAGANVHLSLAFNPSHLEVINPVVLGSVRARQARGGDTERRHYLPVILHGDAAFAGQGINYECLNMSHLEGYRVGGAVHIIVNNQIGFTTVPDEARSTPYCTDVAKMLQVPILHVNGNDPEACFRAINLCMEWRQVFRTDVFLDLVTYRRWGHNETDEPTFTQPGMYRRIKELESTVARYERRLIGEGIAEDKLQAIKERCRKRLDDAYDRLETEGNKIELEALAGQWAGFKKADGSNPDTRVTREEMETVIERITTLPEGFQVHPKLERLLKQRRDAVTENDGKLDWGTAENLAFGTLLREGHSIRISGQDARRGTFSHRHAALYDYETGDPLIPLLSVAQNDARFEVINSLLSEVGVLGYEFGYSLADPRTLVIWEAQFGDFVNGAQVIIDQFLSSCEAKWNRMSGLVMLLPHGYEGQGPEHSSARLERFLQLCSQNNIQVCIPTTPAQHFHLLRRQIKRNFRKPLVVMSPKSLLRHPRAQSGHADFTETSFQEVLSDPGVNPTDVSRVVFCTGKIYYDLIEEREKSANQTVAIVRVEQLYPYPVEAISDELEKFSGAAEIAWAQEEPRNQGAWIYLENRLRAQIAPDQDLLYFGRMPSPSPATGYFKVHMKEQSQIIRMALAVPTALKRG